MIAEEKMPRHINLSITLFEASSDFHSCAVADPFIAQQYIYMVQLSIIAWPFFAINPSWGWSFPLGWRFSSLCVRQEVIGKASKY